MTATTKGFVSSSLSLILHPIKFTFTMTRRCNVQCRIGCLNNEGNNFHDHPMAFVNCWTMYLEKDGDCVEK
jgi:hypothetical protein